MKFEKEENGRVFISMTKEEIETVGEIVTKFKVQAALDNDEIDTGFKSILTYLTGMDSSAKE